MSAWINQIFKSAGPVIRRATKDVAKNGGVKKLREVAGKNGYGVLKAGTQYVMTKITGKRR